MCVCVCVCVCVVHLKTAKVESQQVLIFDVDCTHQKWRISY